MRLSLTCSALLALSGCFVDAFALRDEGGGGSDVETGGAAAGAAGAGATGGAGGSSGIESICDDGIDDDDDGAIDCADADCSRSLGCPPAGWQVVSVEVTGHGDGPSAPCDQTTEMRLSTPNPPMCTPCSCTNTPACSSPTVSCWFDNDTCDGVPDHTTVMATSCSASNLPNIPNGVNALGSCRLTAPSTLITECTDSGSDVSTAAVAEDIHLCGDPPLDYPPEKLCVRQLGDVPCPSGWPNRRTMFASYDDTRNCTCNCNSTCSGGGYVAADNSGCLSNNNPAVSIVGMDCTVTPNLWDFGDGTLQPLAGTPTPSCVPEESGTVAPIGTETLCCGG
jgi:hypothetical protein